MTRQQRIECRLKGFDTESNAHTTADAQSGTASFQTSSFQCMNQGDQDTSPAGTYGMTKSNGPAIDVDLQAREMQRSVVFAMKYLFRVDSKLANDGHGLSSERFVQFEQIDGLHRPICFA